MRYVEGCVLQVCSDWLTEKVTDLLTIEKCSFSAGQKISQILCNLKVNYPFKNTTCSYPNPDQFNLFPQIDFLNIHLNLSSQLCLDLPSSLFRSGLYRRRMK